MFDLIVNLDEIDNDLDKAITKLKNLSIYSCELRLVNGKNIAELTKSECKALKKKLDEFNIKVQVLDSPIFKWSFKDKHSVNYKNVDLFGIKPNLSETEKKIIIDNTLRNAEILNVKNIRIFSGIDSSINEFMTGNSLKLLIQNNEKYNFLIENETSCSIKTVADMIAAAHYLKKNNFQNVKFLFDISNAAINDNGFKITDVYEIKNYIYHLHFKNYRRYHNTIEFVALDKGKLDYKEIILYLSNLFKKNEVSIGLETDIWDPVHRIQTFANSQSYFNKLNSGRR